VADPGVGIDMVSIGKLVTEAISQQFGLLAPKNPVTPDEITPTSNRFKLLSPKMTTHRSSSLAAPATKKRKVSLSNENGELPKKQY
jgi:hypothetical protein